MQLQKASLKHLKSDTYILIATKLTKKLNYPDSSILKPGII